VLAVYFAPSGEMGTVIISSGQCFQYSSNNRHPSSRTGWEESRHADFLVERRGFEPLTSAVQAAARLTGSFGSVIVVPTADAGIRRAWRRSRSRQC
jgi:hypothetical protein